MFDIFKYLYFLCFYYLISTYTVMIYLDYNATTPIDKHVLEAMLPYLKEHYGNPSSNHICAHTASEAIKKARKQVAQLLSCSPTEIIFTSGGSESNNMVLKSIAHTYRDKGNHIITSQIEHPSIINPASFLQKCGFDITYISVDSDGIINLKELEKAVKKQTILISIMHANNETG